MFSFWIIIKSNIFQVFLYSLQFVIFQCDLASWYLPWSISFRQEVYSVSDDLGCVLFEIGAMKRLHWEFMLRGLIVLTGEPYSQMIKGLINLMTDGIIWRLPLWFLSVESSNLIGCQHSRSKSRGGMWEFHNSTYGVLLYPILSLSLPGNLSFQLVLWVLSWSRERTSELLWVGCVRGRGELCG